MLESKSGQSADDFLAYAIIFLMLFVIGGIIGVIFLPSFTGRFYISGLIFGILGTGAGTIIIKIIFKQ